MKKELLDQVYKEYSNHGLSFESETPLKNQINSFLSQHGLEVVVAKHDLFDYYVARVVRVVDLNMDEDEALFKAALEAVKHVKPES